VAVDNALNYQSSQAARQQLEREHHISRLLLDVNNAVISKLDLRELFAAVTDCLHRVMQFAYISLALYDRETKELRIHALDFPEGRGLMHEDIVLPLDSTPSGAAFASRKPVLLPLDRQEVPSAVAFSSPGHQVPLAHPDDFAPRRWAPERRHLREARYQGDAGLLTWWPIGSPSPSRTPSPVARSRDKLAERSFLGNQDRHRFEESGRARRSSASDLIAPVAPTDSDCSSGRKTAAKLIARAIHNLSRRRGASSPK
jgi:formate hydrogenlyase transcriptional activator